MRSEEKIIEHFIQNLIKELPRDTKKQRTDQKLQLSYNQHKCNIHFFKEKPLANFLGIQIAQHLLVHQQQKLVAMIQSKLHYTRKVFAKNCLVRRIESKTGIEFIDHYHLMGSTKSAFYYGLYDTGELVAVAAFSKGRKMNRLEKDQRSYELVRFCTKEGITVTGGLTKLLKCFIEEKDPGDIMTYIDKQFGEGASYLKCGFKEHSETKPHQFLVRKNSLEYTYHKGTEFNVKEFYISQNLGNIKLVRAIEK